MKSIVNGARLTYLPQICFIDSSCKLEAFANTTPVEDPVQTLREFI